MQLRLVSSGHLILCRQKGDLTLTGDGFSRDILEEISDFSPQLFLSSIQSSHGCFASKRWTSSRDAAPRN